MAEHASARNERSTTIVVANALAAQQWELHLAADALGSGAPRLGDAAAQIVRGLARRALARARRRARPGAVGESVARALAPRRRGVRRERRADRPRRRRRMGGRARGSCCTAGRSIRRRSGPAAHQVDYRAFSRLVPRLSRVARRPRLPRSRRARSGIAGRAPRRAAELVVADLAEPYPARATLLAQLAARGMTIETLAAPPRRARCRARATRRRRRRAARGVRLGHATARGEPVRARRDRRRRRPRAAQHEIERLGGRPAGSARSRAGARGGRSPPSRRSAPPLDALALAERACALCDIRPLAAQPVFCAAAARSTFARARLDAELRAELRSQLPFQAAYRCGVAELLDDARAGARRARSRPRSRSVGGVRRATPSRWAHLMTRFLGRARLATAVERGARCSRGRARSTSSRG